MILLTNLTNPACELAASGLELAIDAALAGGLLAVVVLLINLFFRRWLTATQTGILWGLVLIRLLLPWGPASSFSLRSNWDKLTGDRMPAETAAETPTSQPWTSQPRTAKFATEYDSAGRMIHNYLGDDTPDSLAEAPAAGVAQWYDELLIDSLLLWSSVGLFIVLRAVWTNWRFSRAVRRAPICEDQRLLGLWQSSCQKAAVRRAIPIVLFDRVRQPAIMGLFRPTLLLPPDVTSLGDEQLQMIMLHELAHIRRWDVAINWGLVFVRAIHWWNPVYWLAAARFCNLREQACDAFVIGRLAGQSSSEYGNLLLTLAQREPGPRGWRVTIPATILSFISSVFRRRSIGNRLKALRRASANRSCWQSVAVAGLVVLLVCCGLTDAKSTATDITTQSSNVVFPLAFVETNVIKPDATSSDETKNERVHPVPQPRSLPPTPAQGRVSSDTPRPHISATMIECRCITLNRDLKYLHRDLKSAAKIDWHYLAPYSPESDRRPLPETPQGNSTFRATARVEEYIPVVYSILAPETAQSLVDEIQQSTRINIMQAPKVICVNGTEAIVQDVKEQPFVIAIKESSPGVQEPNISVAQEGTSLTFRPNRSAEGSHILLNGRLEFSNIGAVETAQVISKSHPEAEPTAVQVPHVKRYVIDLSSEIPVGHSLLIGSLPDDRSNNNLYLLLTLSDASD